MIRALLSLAGALGVLVLGGWTLDRAMPPDMSGLAAASTVVLDRTGAPLRVFTTAAGRWRLPTDPDRVSPTYLKLLVAVEDKRFFHHVGVDPLALMRATVQLARAGHVVSGGSTLTMQVVRLLTPRPRTVASKLVEILRAVQLEAHWSKREILGAYLTLAPMGRNLEGVRAGSLAWFGKEPGQLSDAEAALLVALPQNPNGLRPDRFAASAERARMRILVRGIADAVLAPGTLRSAAATPLPVQHAMPLLAPHLAERLARAAAPGSALATTLDRPTQEGTERVLRQALAALPSPINLAAVVADWQTGAVLARVGSADYLDKRRDGAIDMTLAVRSPGSTLKPFIYGMAFDGLLAHPGSLVRDAATRFDDYAPHNFDGGFNGDVTVRQALQFSLNLPAVIALQRLGPVVFTERFKDAGLPLTFTDADLAPGLPVALGGVGATLETLVTAYGALARGGEVRPLVDRPGVDAGTQDRLFAAPAADAVVDILADMPPPRGIGSRADRIAYKTGTSYRFRDGWAIGFDDRHVVGVWMGRADGGTCACVGAAAAGLLFRLFDLLPPMPVTPRPPSPFFAAPPPPVLVRLEPTGAAPEGDGPAITFPVAASQLLLDRPQDGDAAPIRLAATGGARPYRWIVDGRPIESRPFARETLWQPSGPGFSRLAVVDAQGRSAAIAVRLVERPSR